MPKNFAREVLSNPNRTKEDIDKAIKLLQKDINYAIKSLHWNLGGETHSSIRESIDLLEQLKSFQS